MGPQGSESALVSRVSCLVCRVSCLVCRVSCVVSCQDVPQRMYVGLKPTKGNAIQVTSRAALAGWTLQRVGSPDGYDGRERWIQRGGWIRDVSSFLHGALM